MESIWILEVVFLLSVIVLGATPVSGSSCKTRNLTVTVDNYLIQLYIDGSEITDLPNANFHKQLDDVELPFTARLIAIRGRNDADGAGILASTADEYVLTNSSWKCSNISQFGWEGIDFDDSAWMSAVKVSSRKLIPGFRSKAEWIWLRQWISSDNEMDKEVYCRKRLAFSTGNDSTSLSVLSGFFGVSVLANIALISAFCILHLRKKIVKDEVIGGNGVINPIHENDNAPGDEEIDAAHYEYLA